MQKIKKVPYYKKSVTTLAQLQKNCIRISDDSRQGSKTKAANIAAMFKSYKTNAFFTIQLGHIMQKTITQAQALNWAAQQLQYVTDSTNAHTYCLDTADALVVVMQQLLDSETIDFAATIANMRYSNDEVNENKYLEESY